MWRFLKGCYSVTRFIVRVGNLSALVLAALLFLQVQYNIRVMEGHVNRSLNKTTCTARRLEQVHAAQRYAADCAEIAKIEVERTRVLEVELETWLKEYDDLCLKQQNQELINRSMKVYIENLHRLLHDNDIPIPPKQTRSL